MGRDRKILPIAFTLGMTKHRKRPDRQYVDHPRFGNEPLPSDYKYSILEDIKKSLDKLDKESPTIKDSDWEYVCKNFDYSSGSDKWLRPTSQKTTAEP